MKQILIEVADKDFDVLYQYLQESSIPIKTTEVVASVSDGVIKSMED
jgi:hypothetical protein